MSKLIAVREPLLWAYTYIAARASSQYKQQPDDKESHDNATRLSDHGIHSVSVPLLQEHCAGSSNLGIGS